MLNDGLEVFWKDKLENRAYRILIEKVKQEYLTSKDVKKYVSYNQINDWEKRLSFLKKKRETASKWRRFSILDLLIFYLLR